MPLYNIDVLSRVLIRKPLEILSSIHLSVFVYRESHFHRNDLKKGWQGRKLFVRGSKKRISKSNKTPSLAFWKPTQNTIGNYSSLYKYLKKCIYHINRITAYRTTNIIEPKIWNYRIRRYKIMRVYSNIYPLGLKFHCLN